MPDIAPVPPPPPALSEDSPEQAVREYKKGTLAYFPHEHEGWVLGSLKTKEVGSSVKMVFEVDETGQDTTFDMSVEKLAKNAYADLPPLKNPESMSRYIYTYSGMVLIAMNPFEYLDLYSVDTMRDYAGKKRDDLEPHLFAIAEEAYREMLNGKDQSIIVSGESGAGKTQSTKYVMRYFATVDSLSKIDDVDALMRPGAASAAVEGVKSEIEEAVLATNPILESFGNAKTTRNDNSSRFGKFIELFFSDPNSGSVRITGAQIRTYLLERSRLVFQPLTERNYHIFYQLCIAAPAAEKEELGLTKWQDFFYLNQGKAGVVKTINDVKDFEDTQKALSTIGISVSMQWKIFRICAALLHLGNVEIEATDNDGSSLMDKPALKMAMKLLDVNEGDFKKWMTKKQIITRGESFIKSLKPAEALVARDSVAKFIYTRLFDWLVRIVNKNLKRDSGDKEKLIGVLDIYGFEHFEVNSFEQFCINYANEKLQQEFNAHVFRKEQDEYIKEKIVWKMIDFSDNKQCIELIEGKAGILDLLDEESRLTTGKDESLLNKLIAKYDKQHKFFAKPRFGNTAFTVKHYAVDVTYTVEGFIEKNKDTVSAEQLDVLMGTKLEFLKEVLELSEEEKEASAAQQEAKSSGGGTLGRKPTVGGASSKKPTLGSMFRSSLVQLMETIRKTESHYIRCIKPNMAKSAFGFDGQMVLSQLRACGVLETIKISCAGYPNKLPYNKFADHYYLLVNSKFWDLKERELAEKIVTTVLTDPDKYQFGLTQVFLRAGQERQHFLMVLGQKNIKKFIQRNRYLRLRKGMILFQALVRGHLARKHYKFLRETTAATKIQACYRRYRMRKLFKKKKASAIKIQSIFRMYRARKIYKNIKQHRAAVKIQSAWRGLKDRRFYRLTLAKLIFIQSSIRRKYAYRELAKLKAEARSVGKLNEVKYMLESKVVGLSQNLNERTQEVKALQEKVASLEEQNKKLKDQMFKVTDDRRAAVGELNASNSTAKDVQILTEQRDTIAKDRDRLEALLKKRDEEFATQSIEMQRMKERQRLQANAPNKRMSTSSVTSGPEDPVVVALRAEIQQLKRMLAGQTGVNGVNGTGENGYLNILSVNGGISESPVASPRMSRGDSVSSTLKPRPSARRAGSYMDSDIFADAERERLKKERGSGHAGSLSLPRASSPLRGVPNGIPSVVIPGRIMGIEGPIDEASAEEQIKALEDSELSAEIKESLIVNVHIPNPAESVEIQRRDVMLPAHMIGYVVRAMLEHDMLLQIQNLISFLNHEIFNAGSQPDDDFRPIFWISNVHELICIVSTVYSVEAKKPNNKAHVNVLKKLRSDLDNLVKHLLTTYLTETKKHVASMAVAAVLETQDLPGLKAESGGFWNFFGGEGAPSEDDMTSLKGFLSGLDRIMDCYYMVPEYRDRILNELIRVVSVTGFNGLLKKRGFANFRRGCQIQYNVTQLEEWCNANSVRAGPAHLARLMQASKILTMNKSDPLDAEAIYEMAYLLNKAQVAKLFQNYPPTDPDSKMSPIFLQTLIKNATATEKTDVVLLSLDPDPSYPDPAPRHVSVVETYIPPYITLPKLSRVII
ncbi:Myosin type-2 heavy chain 1 [Irineochytrium annulatum]|nr:Myosin type-2 heavy chain 1 [Irineochytrium annulatum]